MVNLIVVVGNATPEENGIFMNERAPKEVGVALPGLFCENICTRGGVFSQASARYEADKMQPQIDLHVLITDCNECAGPVVALALS
jgi:hypothetical protein